MIAWEEQQREGRGRWDDVIESGGRGYASDAHPGGVSGNGTFAAGGRNGDAGTRGLDPSASGRVGAGDEDGGKAEVTFKGRGSMKYRERKW